MKKQILVDVDGVLLAWREAFDQYMAKKGVIPIVDKQQSFDLSTFYGLDRDSIYKEVNEFNSGHWRFGTLRAYPDAIESIKHLHNDLNYRFVAITSCSSSPVSVALRKANLFNHYGDVFDEIHCLDVGVPKQSYLSKYEPTYWIEDNINGCLAGLDFGHNCILVTRDHNENEHDDRWTRCNDWYEITNIIKSN